MNPEICKTCKYKDMSYNSDKGYIEYSCEGNCETQGATVLGWTRDERGNVIDRHPVEVANAVTAGKRDNTQNYVVCASRGRGDGWQQQLEERTDGITNTITGVQKDNKVHNNYRIRKLTPRECFRLMGVSEPDIDTLLSAGISNSQLYKLAGNSIVVNCLAGIFRQLFIGNFNNAQQLEIF